MALPSRPNARLGLPANPRSRSLARRPNASVDLPLSREDMMREYVPSRPAPTPPPVQQVRPTRSMTDMRSAASRSRSVDRGRTGRPSEPPPPLPVAPSAWQARELNPPPRSTEGPLKRFISQRKRTNGIIPSWGSSSSESSNSGNSLRSYTSYASSQTSLADDDMKTTSPTGQSSTSPSMPSNPERPPSSLGTSIWSRVATAAEHLKVNVNKAMSSTVTIQNGEGTPEGQESSLSKAMKAYHVDKAQGDAKELPDWLFEGRDQEIINRLRGPSPDQQPAAPAPSRADTPSSISRSTTASPAPERGRSRVPGVGMREHSLPRRDGSVSGGIRDSVASIHATVPSRDSMHRLKELRLAKRNARVRFEGHEDKAEEDGPPRPRTPSQAGTSRPVAPPSAFKEVPLPEIAPLYRRPTGYSRNTVQEGGASATSVVQPRSASLNRRPTGYTRESSREREIPPVPASTLARRPTGLPARAPSRAGRRSSEESAASSSTMPLVRRPTGLPQRAPSREGRRIGLPGSVRPQKI
ncbi:hypothetical protein DAEQUDRAFT_727132 [Daedalea quercina L-15889]|uniref:Uncharacterized protein n=1 Tax=Daedalea quercina L-15889 TaxID=1314783 RepID=A0A165Q3H4_9APHY|nr:hypothetical protein DAEQUDRAFT_727132 [Daedalea quercina L-15889]